MYAWCVSDQPRSEERYVGRFRCGTGGVDVLTSEDDLMELLPTLIPEYWRPEWDVPATTRLALGRSSSGWVLCEDQYVIDRATPADLPGTLEFALARALLRSCGAEAHLHAAGILVGGRALLIVGPSGSGKSSLALQMARCGYPLLTDDFILVHGHGHVSGLRRYLKLDTETLQALGFTAEDTVHWQSGASEAWVDPATLGGWARGPVAVGWVVFLTLDRSVNRLRALPPSQALENLLSARSAARKPNGLSILTGLLDSADTLDLSATSHAQARKLLLDIANPP